jgi:hypothetical protein
MGATRAVLLIPNGECDPAARAAAAQTVQIKAAAQSTAETAAGTQRKPALVLGGDGRVDPMFFKPFSPALLSKMQTQSN